MICPSASDFAALARSSPWLWSTLRFTVNLPSDRWNPRGLRAWLRRPDRLRVETTNGTLVRIVRESREQGYVIRPDGVRYTQTVTWPTDHGAPQPQRRADGLVTARPGDSFPDVSFDDPMYENYFWVAMLGPGRTSGRRQPGCGHRRAPSRYRRRGCLRRYPRRAPGVGGDPAADPSLRAALFLLFVAAFRRSRQGRGGSGCRRQGHPGRVSPRPTESGSRSPPGPPRPGIAPA